MHSHRQKRLFPINLLLALILLAGLLSGCLSQGFPTAGTPAASPAATAQTNRPAAATTVETAAWPEADGHYTAPEEVAAYLHAYRKLPDNYLTKREAAELGWEASRGNLWDVTDRMSIGGDRFGNREGLLPEAEGRIWHECDVNYHGGFRGAERLVYSNDGLIYYTKDHYRSFILLYGE